MWARRRLSRACKEVFASQVLTVEVNEVRCIWLVVNVFGKDNFAPCSCCRGQMPEIKQVEASQLLPLCECNFVHFSVET